MAFQPDDSIKYSEDTDWSLGFACLDFKDIKIVAHGPFCSSK